MKIVTVLYLALATSLLPASLAYSAERSCSDELKACYQRCAGPYGYTGKTLALCKKKGCDVMFTKSCMKTGIWKVTKQNRIVTGLKKK